MFVSELEQCGLEYYATPKLRNVLFMHATASQIYAFRDGSCNGSRLFFMRSHTGEQIYVSDKAMQSFITICTVCEMPVVMTTAPIVRLGDRVRVISGPMAGLEGNVVRMRKQKRVLVNIDNVVWAATSYISPDQLEVIESAPEI